MSDQEAHEAESRLDAFDDREAREYLDALDDERWTARAREAAEERVSKSYAFARGRHRDHLIDVVVDLLARAGAVLPEDPDEDALTPELMLMVDHELRLEWRQLSCR